LNFAKFFRCGDRQRRLELQVADRGPIGQRREKTEGPAACVAQDGLPGKLTKLFTKRGFDNDLVHGLKSPESAHGQIPGQRSFYRNELNSEIKAD
jgi:hypothetical protein